MKTLSDLSKDIEKMKEDIIRKAGEELAELGEEACTHARMSAGYNDMTGTTRSAFKYRVQRDGSTIAEGGYEEVPGVKPKTLNPEQLADEALDTESGGVGLTLTFVNGSPYAKYLEDNGRNVTHLTEAMMRDKLRN